MTMAKMDLGAVVSRLAEMGAPRVDDALAFAELGTAAQLPATFVLPDSETAAANRVAGIVDQRIEAVFMVVSLLKPGRGASARRDGIQDAAAAVVVALLGWVPPWTSAPTEYAGGRLLSVSGGAVAWASRFRTSYHLRARPS